MSTAHTAFEADAGDDAANAALVTGACRVCGGNDFRFIETELWQCAVNEDGVLSCSPPGNESNEICCFDCDKTYYPRDFARVDFT